MSALKYWLWLTELPGLTNQTRLALLQHFPTPEDVYYAEARRYPSINIFPTELTLR